MKNYILKILSKSPFQIVLFLILTTTLLSTYLSSVILEYKVIYSLFYLGYLAWFLSGKIKDLILYIFAILLVFVAGSVTSVALEKTSNGITAVLFPSILFTFFGTQTFIEFTEKYFKHKVIVSLFTSILDIAILLTSYSFFPSLNNYFALIISIIVTMLVGTIFIIRKINKKEIS